MASNPSESPSLAADWLRGNLAPLPSTAYDVISGENFVGDPTRDGWLSLSRAVLAENLLPIWVQSVALGSGDPVARLARGATEFMGMRASEASFARMRDDLQLQVARENGYRAWDEIKELDQRKLTEANPELKRLTEAASEAWAKSNSPEAVLTNKVSTEIEGIQKTSAAAINDAAKAFRATGDGRAFVEAVQTEGKILARQYEQIYNSPEGQAAQALWQEWAQENDAELEAKGLKKPLEDIAYGIYNATIANAGDLETVDPETGLKSFDYRERDRRVAEFKADWGDSVWQYIQARKKANKDGYPPEYFEYQDAKEVLKPYWDIEDDALAFAETKYPGITQLREDYENWSKTATSDQMAYERARHPELGIFDRYLKATQELWRRNHLDADKYLVRFYGRKDIRLQK